MKTLTWKQFKKFIDQRLKESGISQNEKIYSIGVFLPKEEEIKIDVMENSKRCSGIMINT